MLRLLSGSSYSSFVDLIMPIYSDLLDSVILVDLPMFPERYTVHGTLMLTASFLHPDFERTLRQKYD